jgi:hypothetical protein
MHILGDFSSFLGSVWFACFTALSGYIFAHIFPVKRFIQK